MTNGRSGADGGERVFRVVEDLRTRMAGGDFPPGALLPAQRQLAEDYAVSRDTVQKALGQLRQEGRVVSRQGSGTRVVKARQVQPDTARAAVEGRQTARLQKELLGTTHRHSSSLRAGPACRGSGTA
ncbi:GntR family transcriptional regulator [Streptomyces sp. NPDC049813]|uniref:GntR family transcriptional regulator n=1 Tax=Streptomyces sp. NPDC049813 TaxID=3365597 RepID=UPI003797ACE7